MAGSMYMETGVRDALYEILLALAAGQNKDAEQMVRELLGDEEQDEEQDEEGETVQMADAYEHFCSDHLPPIYDYGQQKRHIDVNHIVNQMGLTISMGKGIFEVCEESLEKEEFKIIRVICSDITKE